jgi:hypothetical protein
MLCFNFDFDVFGGGPGLWILKKLLAFMALARWHLRCYMWRDMIYIIDKETSRRKKRTYYRVLLIPLLCLCTRHLLLILHLLGPCSVDYA